MKNNKQIHVFAYKFKRPMNMPLVDCRVLPNPYKEGVPDDVLRERVRALPEFAPLVDRCVNLFNHYEDIGIGCLWGRHRSVAVASEVARITGATITRVIQ